MSKHLQSGRHPDADQISAFVDHALPEHERKEMLAHLAECTDCRETVALSLPAIPNAPEALKKSKSWFWDLRFLLPAGAAALAVVLLYVHHATNSQSEDVRRGPEIALERPAAPEKDQKSSPGGAGGGAGSTSLAGRVLETPHRIPGTGGASASKDQGKAEGNRLAVGQEPQNLEVHLPDGRNAISTVTRGLQVLAIDNRNQLFLSNDHGISWIAVRGPWKGRAVKAELALFRVPTTPIQQAAGGVGAGFGAGIGGDVGATLMDSDAARFKKQKELRQELKGSYKALGSANSDTPSAVPAPALTAPAPSAPRSSEGTMSGTIRDRSGAIISGASVALTRQDNKSSLTAVTGPDGRYQIAGLSAGTYQLEARAPGFNAARISGIQIASSTSSSKDLVLDVGASSQTVAVEANPPEIESALPELGRNAITQKQKSASPNALVRSIPVFEITTDSGDRWTSSDGISWQRR
jgi:hypothetical protein